MNRIVVMFCGAMTLSSCAYWNRVKPDLASCAAGVVPAAIADLQKKVMSVLIGGDQQTWTSFAKAELLQYGVEFASCAVLAALHDINAPTPAPTASPARVRANKRAYAWLRAHGK